MKTKQNEPDIRPELLYSVKQAARYFGVHRCTIYDYLSNPVKPLPFLKSERNGGFPEAKNHLSQHDKIYAVCILILR